MIMEYVLPVLIVLLAIFFIGWWLHRSILRAVHKDTETQSLVLLQNQIQAGSAQAVQQAKDLQSNIHTEMQKLNEQVSRALSESNRIVGDRLDNAGKVIGDVRQRLGQMDEASRRIFDIGQEIAELQQTLKAPKLRGTMGELMLIELLSQVLPVHSFAVQHRFKGGETVDAVIKLSSGMVAVDAKFPLENFKRIYQTNNEEEQSAFRKQLMRDVKKHIDAIAEKYIRTDEGTFDFAMMYIPSETVYYEIISDSEKTATQSIFNYSLKKRVIPVSPNSFYAYLQTILLGLRGMKVAENAREIMDNLARLTKEFNDFMDDFRLVGQHLSNSQKKFAEAERRLGKVETKIEQMSGPSKQIGEDHGMTETGVVQQ